MLGAHNNDCLEVMKLMESNSIDSLVTDPPAGISFMGKAWDHHKGGRDQWIVWMQSVMSECLRVLKPGAHGLVWALPRTSHWTATALENAGFEVRDVVTHLFGTGFPKSLDISKAIDKAVGAERTEVIGKKAYETNGNVKGGNFGVTAENDKSKRFVEDILAPSTDLAKQWEGWGTALKPASEHWILVRKPCSEKTVAANVEKWGVGGINIDGCRIGAEIISTHGGGDKYAGLKGNGNDGIGEYKQHSGRFPANLVLDEVAAEMLDQQSGVSKSSGGQNREKNKNGWSGLGADASKGNCGGLGDSGGASRFFYVAKASKSERDAGLESLPEVESGIGDHRPSGQSMQRLDGREPRKIRNTHPTVKALKLMEYLCKLVTPPNGIILDPFMGSGSTGVAARANGFRFIGIEREQEYFDIALKRISG